MTLFHIFNKLKGSFANKAISISTSRTEANEADLYYKSKQGYLESFTEFYFLRGCFLAEEAPVTSRRAWLEFVRIEEDLGTCALRFFKKSNPVFKHSGGGISLYITVSILHPHTS